jgi:hypothetical protein
MKLSIVIPVLDSHEIVRRQSLYFEKMPLPDDAELILVDDGSDPPIECPMATVIATNDRRPWTQPKARNIGAAHARGEFLLLTDIDHIVTQEAVGLGRNYSWDYGKFKREFGVLDEWGEVHQDYETLMEYGVPASRLESRKLRLSCHTLSMIIRRSLFEDLGGYREKLGRHPTHDDGHMKRQLRRKKGITKCPDDDRPWILMIPNGRYCGDNNANPFGLFHSAKR